MGHSSLTVSLTYLRGLEVSELEEGGDRNDYIEEYGIDYPYEPLEDILK